MSPTITALKSHPTRPGRVRVEIDGQYAFELSRKVIRARAVVEGEILTPERRANLESIAAREAAILLLGSRERSRHELAVALKRKGFAKSVITTILDHLQADGLQSDTRFADSWVENRQRLAPRGRTALVYELKQRGIADTEIAQAVQSFTPEDELAVLRELIGARLERLQSSESDRLKIKRRLLGFLARRGFAYYDISTVLHDHFPDWA